MPFWLIEHLERDGSSDSRRAQELLWRAAELARQHRGGAVEREAEALLADPLGV
jgi:hypothetical protein